MRPLFAFVKPVVAAVRAEFDRRYPQRHAVVVDLTLFHGGDRWGLTPKRVYGVTRFHSSARRLCRRWVAKHTHGQATVIPLETMPGLRARLGYDHWVDVRGEPLSDRGLPRTA